MWFWLGLLSAVIAAVSVTINKHLLKKVNASVLTLVLFSLNIPLIAFFAFKRGVDSTNQWFYLGAIGSGVVFAVAKLLRLSGLKKGLMSKIIPLTSFSTVFTYILSLIFLSEIVKPLALTGLMLTMVGAYTLNIEESKQGLLKPLTYLLKQKESLLFLMGMVLTAVSSVFDKLSLVNVQPSNPSLTLLVENITVTLLMLVYLQTKKNSWVKQIKDNFWSLTGASLIYGIGAVILFMGFTEGPIALVGGLKRMHIFFILISGYIFFNDKPSKGSIMASLLMIAGVVLIKLA